MASGEASTAVLTNKLVATLLCVDDEANILAALNRVFRPEGYRVLTATSGVDGLKLLESEPVDLVISDMRMPEMDGVQFLAEARRRWPDTMRLLLTGHADISSTIEAINQGEIYRYLSKPWDDNEVRLIVRHALERKLLEQEKARLEALTMRQNEELQALNASLEAKVTERTAELKCALDSLAAANERLKVSFITSIKVFSNLTELAEGPRAGHSRRVADLGRRLALQLGLDRGAAQDVMVAGLLHDIGKIGFPDALLAKAIPQLTSEELRLYKRHTLKGEAALMALEDIRNAARLLRSHHERYDGRGFPDRLREDSIPLGARILAVVNDYDGLQIGTLSVKRLSASEARAAIQQARGTRYDPAVLDGFFALVGSGDSGATLPELQLEPRQLRPGMVLTRDLITRDGVLLLAADYMLEESLIHQIREFAENEDGRFVIHVRADTI